MAKKRKAARKQPARKPAPRKRSRSNPDATVNTLVILVVIVMVLGGLILYAQNTKKQAALLPGFLQAIASLAAPEPTALPVDTPEITGSIPKATPAAAKPPATTDKPPRPTSAIEIAPAATVAAIQNDD